MQVNLSSPGQIAAQVSGLVKPWLMFTGVVLTAAIALELVAGFRVPFVSGGQEQMYLAALLIWAGR